MADLVDRQDDWRVSYANFSPGVTGEIPPGPLTLDMAENTRLRAEIQALKLHLDLVHDCKGPRND